MNSTLDPAAHAAELARRSDKALYELQVREQAEYEASVSASAAAAAAATPPKKKAPRKPRVSKKAQEAEAKARIIDDELMGLVEGDNASAAPSAADDVLDELMDDGTPQRSAANSPSARLAGVALPVLTNSGRAKILNLEDPSIAHRVSLEEDAWRQSSKTADVRKKDGSIRRKPGPRKGWKDLAKQQGIDLATRKGSAGPSALRQHVASSDRGDAASNPGGSVRGWEEGSHRMGTDYGSDADSSIAVLIDDDKAVSESSKRAGKRRKLENGAVEGQQAYPHDDDDSVSALAGARSSEIPDDETMSMEGSGAAPAVDPSLKRLAKSGRVKEPGVGKGKWTRPSKQAKELQQSEARMAMYSTRPEIDEAAYQISREPHLDVSYLSQSSQADIQLPPRNISPGRSSPMNGFSAEFQTPPLPG